MLFLLSILFSIPLFSQTENCSIESLSNSRSIYSLGDTLSQEDQNIEFPICNGSGDYSTGDVFSFSDMNGNLNGGDYKVTIISMNATW